MKKTIALLFCMLVGSAFAAIDDPKSIDFTSQTQPALQVYQASEKSYLWTVRNAGQILDLSGYTPFMYWATSNTASAVVTASVEVVSATAGTFRATFSPASLNYAGGIRGAIYAVGVSSNNITIARQGGFTIIADPYAAGVSPIDYSTNVNWGNYNWVGLPEWTLLSTFTAATQSLWAAIGSVSGAGWSGFAATQTVDLASNAIDEVTYINFDTAYEDGIAEGRLQWNVDAEKLEYGLVDGGLTLKIGDANVMRVRASENILKGQVVSASGQTGNARPNAILSDADSTNLTRRVPTGVALQNINENQSGYIVTAGLADGMNTTAYPIDVPLFLSTTAGGLTTNKPAYPYDGWYVAESVLSNATEGQFVVNIVPCKRWEDLDERYATGTPVYVESDPIWTAASGLYYTASQADALFITGAPVLVESDPVWAAASNLYATTAGVAAAYLPLTGGTISGNLTASNSTAIIEAAANKSGNKYAQLYSADSLSRVFAYQPFGYASLEVIDAYGSFLELAITGTNAVLVRYPSILGNDANAISIFGLGDPVGLDVQGDIYTSNRVEGSTIGIGTNTLNVVSNSLHFNGAQIADTSNAATTNDLANYLPLAGGTLTGTLNITNAQTSLVYMAVSNPAQNYLQSSLDDSASIVSGRSGDSLFEISANNTAGFQIIGAYGGEGGLIKYPSSTSGTDAFEMTKGLDINGSVLASNRVQGSQLGIGTNTISTSGGQLLFNGSTFATEVNLTDYLTTTGAAATYLTKTGGTVTASLNVTGPIVTTNTIGSGFNTLNFSVPQFNGVWTFTNKPNIPGYLTTTGATATYLTQANAASTYLTSTGAVANYLSITNAAATYINATNLTDLIVTTNNLSNIAGNGLGVTDNQLVVTGFAANASGWSEYSATQDVSFASNGLTNVDYVQFVNATTSAAPNVSAAMWVSNNVPQYIDTGSVVRAIYTTANFSPATYVTISAGNANYWRITTAPTSSTSSGSSGQMAVSGTNFYIYSPNALGAGTGRWGRINMDVSW